MACSSIRAIRAGALKMLLQRLPLQRRKQPVPLEAALYNGREPQSVAGARLDSVSICSYPIPDRPPRGLTLLSVLPSARSAALIEALLACVRVFYRARSDRAARDSDRVTLR